MGDRMNVKPLTHKRVPVSKPPFELKDLKKAIPPHCFKRSLVRSFSALFRDLIIVGALYYLAHTFIPMLPKPLAYAAWPVYWFFQGAYLMALWLIGHECGHYGFSEYPWLNDTIGFIVHSLVLTPYFGFKYSHRTHHANTNNIEYDEVWIPKRKADTLYSEVLNNPTGAFFIFVLKIVLGLPLYFMFNLYGRKYDKGITSHFYPYSPIFNDSERFQIFLTDLGVFATCYAAYRAALVMGAQWVINIYGMPVLFMSGFFIVLTYLQHTHPSIPHYDSTEWDWLRGALATVDRDFGFLNHAYHDVTKTHIVHHLFPTLPHYHSLEATEAIKPILGEYYKYDDTPVLKAIWRETKDCIFVEPDDDDVNGEKTKKGIYWFYK